MGVPYVPVIGLVGSNVLDNRDDMIIQPDPFDPSHSSVVARAYRPDVALLHGLKADRHGNVFLGRESDDVLLAEASRLVIVTVESIVDRLDDAEMMRALPSILVDTIVETTYGAHPAGCPGAYPADAGHMARYLEAARDDASFHDYLHETVIEVPNHDAYAESFVPAEWKNSLATAHRSESGRPA